MNPKIIAAEFESLKPTVDKKYSAYVPKVTTPVKASIIIDNIRAAEANALRRTILNELPVLILHAEYEDIITDDAFPIGEMIQGVLNRIPIKQTAQEGSKYTLEVKNDSADAIYVTAGDLRGPEGLFNNEFIILTLKPGYFIKITAHVVKVKGYKSASEQIGVLACQGTIVPQDVQMYDRYIPVDPNEADPIKADSIRGQRSSTSEATKYKLMFKTLGTATPQDICIAAANNIIERLASVKSIEISRVGSDYSLFLEDESMTLGTLLMRTSLDVDYNSNLTARQLTSSRTIEVRFRLGTEFDSADKFIATISDTSAKYFAALVKEFSAIGK